MIYPNSADNYAQALAALAPQGVMLSRDSASNWMKLLAGLAQEFARVDANVLSLQNEAFPDTADVLIENWERILGIPQAGSTLGATLADRQAAVAAQVRARGGQSAAYFTSVYQAYGYDVLVENASTFVADGGVAGGLVFGEDWDFYFVVSAFAPVSNHANFEALQNNIKPAQTTAIFCYP